MPSAADLYRRWISDVWHGNFSVADDILTPDFVGHWPGFDVHGPQGAVSQVRLSHDFFAGVTTTLDVGPIVDGDLVSARWTFHGAYRGGIPGATAEEGTRVSFVGHDIFRVADGRFAEYWVVSDGLGMMTALGAV